ncbi:MAG: hypothetical protein ACJ76J_05820 [Thermoanaerobaculia bacterium]
MLTNAKEAGPQVAFMSAIELRASDQHQRVPDALRLAFLLVFKPRELWARMVLWDLDGDPGLAFIWPLRGRHQRAWVRGLAEILGAAAMFAYAVLLNDYGWSVLLGRIAIALLVAILVACVAGIAFATLLGILAAVTMMVGVWLPRAIAGVSAMAALWCFGIGFAVWISWVISERVFDKSEALHSGHHSHQDLRLYVLVGGAFACYLSGETGLQRIALAGLLGFGILLHPLVELIYRVVQRRRKPLAFLSYRRHDDESRGLAKELHRRLPPGSAFLDELMPSGEWQPRILSALGRATVFLAFVGPRWQEEGKKEEDEEEGYTAQMRSSFWVCFELGYAWRRKIPIRPIMVGYDGHPPPHLSDFQCSSVRSEEDLKNLIDILKREDRVG